MTIAVSEVLAHARARTDKTNSTFISDAIDGVPWVDKAHRELYELLVTSYGDEYFMQTSDLAVTATAQKTSIAQLAIGGGAEPEYRVPWKLVRVDVAFNSKRVPMSQLSFSDAVLDDTGDTWAVGMDLRYRWANTSLWWHPRPDAAQTVRVYFVPVVDELTDTADTIEPVCEPWVEFLVAAVSLSIAMKERDDAAIKVFMAEKADLRQRVVTSAPARDIGQPQTIADVRGNHEEGFHSDRWR